MQQRGLCLACAAQATPQHLRHAEALLQQGCNLPTPSSIHKHNSTTTAPALALQVSPSQTPTACMAEQMQQERQRRRAARKGAISLHKQQLRSQIEQLQQALQQANSQLHILGGTSVPDPLEMGPDGQGGSSARGKAAFRSKQGRTGSMQEHLSSSSAGDMPGGAMIGADVGRHDTGNSQVGPPQLAGMRSKPAVAHQGLHCTHQGLDLHSDWATCVLTCMPAGDASSLCLMERLVIPVHPRQHA